MGKKARRYSSNPARNESNVVALNYHDTQARLHGPKKKKWSIHDLRTIKPLTQKQSDLFELWCQGDNLCAHGSAGTGKTFLAFFLAMNEYLEYGEHQQIIVVRSAVSGREIGHLPGTKEEKEEVFELPYADICNDMFGKKSTYQDMKDAGMIKFMTTSHIRGLTWDNAIIIVDEAQNMDFSEIDSVITRIGKNSKLIVCGDDKKQCDLGHREVSGLTRMIAAFKDMKGCSTVEFTYDDVVRSGFVKSWLKATKQV